MPRTRRGFGRIRQCQPSGRYQASYVGPDDRLYKAPATFAAKIDAEAWLTDRRREMDRELWSPPATVEQTATKRRAEVRFGDYADNWVETRTVKGRPLAPRTQAHYRMLLDKHIKPEFGSKPVRDINMALVDKWYAKTLPDHPTMRAHAYSLLRTILETAHSRDRLINANPCLIRGGGTVERKIKPKPATLEELAVIVEEMPDNLQLMVLLASWCALRFGELVELRRGDIDVDGKAIRVRRGAVRVDKGWKAGDPKSAAGRRDVAIPPHIMPAVTEHLTKHVGVQRDALVFPASAGGRLHPSALQQHYYKARAKAKRTDLRWHDLRHTGATLAAQSGATLAELMSRLGHSTPQAAMRYQHAAQGRDAAIAQRMSKLATQQTGA
jgi:integrase